MKVLYRPAQLVILLLFSLLSVSPVWSRTEADKPAPLQPLTEKQVQANDATLDRIQSLRSELAELAVKADHSRGVEKAIYEKRQKKRWLELLSVAADFAKTVAKQADSNYDVSTYKPDVKSLLDKLPGEVRKNIGQTHLKFKDLPDANMPAEEQLIRDAKLMEMARENDRYYQALLTALQFADKFGVPTAVDRPALQKMLSDRAETQSVWLEQSIEDAESLRFQSGSLPDDEKLKKRLTVVENRVNLIATSLAETVHMMDALGMEGSQFREQVVKATGEISSDVLDKQVLRGIVVDWIGSVIKWVQNKAPSLLVKILTFSLIVYLFVLLARIANRVLTRTLDSSRLRVSRLLRRVAVSTTQNVIMIMGILIALSQMGIEIAPMLAGLGIAGFILGFALQDTLSNFFSGMMILLYRPFDTGDVVEAGGAFGTVSNMSLVNTTILTFDNQTLVIPNNKIWGEVIKNVTAQKIRRVDMTFGISYTDEIPKAEKILRDILTSHAKVLKDPEPVVRLHTLGESSVDFIARPWVNRDNYWDVYWDITREVKMRFDAEGVTIPFPQRDLHLYTSTNGDRNREIDVRQNSLGGELVPEQDTSAARPIEPDTNHESA